MLLKTQAASLPLSHLPHFMLSGCITGGPTPTNTPAGRDEGVCEQEYSHLLRGDTLHINAIPTVNIIGSLNMDETIFKINGNYIATYLTF